MKFFAPKPLWKEETKGLRKELVSYNYISTMKATEISKCVVKLSDLQNLQSRNSNYLNNPDSNECVIEMGSALTPIDCYIEEFLLVMHINEESRCYVSTRSGEEISFVLKLLQVDFGGYYFELSAERMYELGLKYKQNGVKMFQEYPLFAQHYFNLSAKCLLSYSALRDVTEPPGIDNNITDVLNKMNTLLETVYLNLSLSLIKQNRFEEVVYLLAAVDKHEHPNQKAIYRKALAHFNLKQFEEAKRTLEKTDYLNNKEMSTLWTKLHANWKVEEIKYSDMVKKMFRS